MLGIFFIFKLNTIFYEKHLYSIIIRLFLFW